MLECVQWFPVQELVAEMLRIGQNCKLVCEHTEQHRLLKRACVFDALFTQLHELVFSFADKGIEDDPIPI